MPLAPDKSDKGSGGLISARLPTLSKCRYAGQALTTRALLHLGEGRTEEAWQDLLACHRLARLVARGSTLIERLVGIAIDNVAGEADLAFLESAKLDAKQTMRCLKDLQELPPIPPPAEAVDLLERFSFLDIVMLLDRHGPQFLETLTGVLDKEFKLKQIPNDVNWDPALRAGNKIYDRMAAAMRVKDRGARDKALRQIETDIKELKAALTNGDNLAKDLIGPKATPETRGKALGDVLVCLMTPATTRVQQAADRQEQTQRNLHIAFALGAYQREHGSYPKALEALAPKYLASVPLDLFTAKSLTYVPEAKGFLLYSFGVNGKDDQGRTAEDNPPGDDLRVRLPLPPWSAKKS
jgi:hypothetical protein